jgi:hypothetical protein
MCKNTEGAINRKMQRNWQHKVHKTREKSMLENTEGEITKKRKSRETVNIG